MLFVENQIKPFRALRSIVWTALLLCVVSNVGWMYAYLKLDYQDRELIYVVGQDGTFVGRLQDRSAPSIFEARNHLKRFVELMFSHDAENYDQRIEQALHLIDKEEGLLIYQDFEEHQVRDNYVKHGSRSLVEVESIELDMSQEPYRGKVWAKQQVLYKDKKKAMPISAVFSVIRTRRTEQNPFGLLLREWKFIPYLKKKGGMS